MTDISRRKWLQSSLLASSALLISGSANAALDLSKKQITQQNNELIKLNYNENPWGPSKKAREAVIKGLDISNRYPDDLVENLKKKIALKNQTDPRQVFISAGSTEILSLLGQHVGLMKGEILTAWPTFPTIISAGEIAGATTKKVLVDSNERIDLNKLNAEISDKTSLIFLCNPNNPTSTEVDTKALKAFCRAVPSNILLCVDEAYIEYSKNGLAGSMMSLVSELPNLVVIRTFSKAYGLAGLRIGYAISSMGNIEQLQMRHPGREIAAGVAPLSAAIATMEDPEFLRHCVSKNQEGKQIVYDAYQKWGVSHAKSSTSFIYTRHEHFDKDVVSKMKKDGVLITKWNDMKDHIRISIGKPSEMEAFVKKAEKYLV
ncbi:MAG: histidinol-phosphate aminotransferase family protein [Cyclobacteriaceae bacterium]|nr:histidinol-phosphate aminotransferase family protein [Cyclobacteriaceae bacterium]